MKVLKTRQVVPLGANTPIIETYYEEVADPDQPATPPVPENSPSPPPPDKDKAYEKQPEVKKEKIDLKKPK